MLPSLAVGTGISEAGLMQGAGTPEVAAEKFPKPANSKTRRWVVALAACGILGLVIYWSLRIYGTRIALRGAAVATRVATEQRITANPAEAPISTAVVSPDGKYVAHTNLVCDASVDVIAGWAGIVATWRPSALATLIML
jgi:hypothetical protein